MIEIIPSIIAKSRKELLAKIRLAERFAGCKTVQLDIMDGIFVPNKTVNFRSLVGVKSKLDFEIHLMVAKPERDIEKYIALKPKRIIFHVESTSQVDYLLSVLKKGKIQASIAMNPRTTIKKITPYLKKIDSLLLLSVQPGFYGSKFQSSVYTKIKKIKKLAPKLPIAIDGGVDLKNASLLARAGATRFTVGSRIYSAKNPSLAYKDFCNVVS